MRATRSPGGPEARAGAWRSAVPGGSNGGTGKAPRTSTYRCFDPTGQGELYEYTERDNLAAQIAPDGARYEWEYDRLGRVAVERNELGRERHFTYDAEGNLTRRESFAGEETVYEYDALGRMVEEIGFDGNRYRYAYDAAGNLVEADSSDSELRFAYDAAGRLMMSEDALSEESRIEYEPDSIGRVIAEVWPQAGREARYRYDSRGLLSELTDPDGGVTRFTYDEAGGELTRELPDGARIERHFDAAGRLAATASEEPGRGIVDARAYAYSPGGRIRAEADESGSFRRFDYDDSGRLASVASAHEDSGIREAQFRSFQMAGVLDERDEPTRQRAQTSGGHRWSERESLEAELHAELSGNLSEAVPGAYARVTRRPFSTVTTSPSAATPAPHPRSGTA